MTKHLLSLLVCIWLLFSCGNKKAEPDKNRVAPIQEYKCLPCGTGCDTLSFDQPGICTHCRMELVKKESIRHGSLQIASLCSENKEELVFLDVRSEEEFEGRAEEKFGAIKGAINIPVQELENRIKELDAFKKSKIIVYCSHSHRSPRAAYLLTQNGFTNVFNLEGGMSVWKEQMKNPDCNQTFYQNQQ